MGFRLTRKNLQLFLVLMMFFCVTAFAFGFFPQLSELGLIQDDKSFIGDFTVGDGLRLFGIFGTCATLAIWFSYYKRMKRS